jgi:hypothetical protein
MGVHPHSEPMSEPDKSAAGGVGLIDLRPVPSDAVYDLRRGGGNSDRYYAEAAAFADKVLAEIELRAGPALDGYTRYVQVDLREAARSRGEYAVELLTLGMALRRYSGVAEHTARWVVELASELYWVRRQSQQMKPVADFVRAVITRYLLAPNIGREARSGWRTPAELPLLIEWLQATGEFEHESMRLNNWRSFLGTFAADEGKLWLVEAERLFEWFEREAAETLGGYTRGVQGFLAGEHRRRGCREDQIFCGKEPVEYHLNMVAAEIMNRGLREGFERTPHRVVLVPACMRGAKVRTCRAQACGSDILCTGCDPDCTVNRITRRLRTLGAEVYIIAHATGFSRWLARWQYKPDFGVTAVACLLNILPGGYEMRARGIASQCVPLDYPGCQKHWRKDATPTNLNHEKLVQIVAGPGH